MAAAITLSSLPVRAAGLDRGSPLAGYTHTATRASAGRTMALFVDHDFHEADRERILSAVQQWNHVLNGFLELRPMLLPAHPTEADIAHIRRTGAWILARVDGRHPIARQREGQQALGVTVGGNQGGFVYVISDRMMRMSGRDFTGVVMHELGHVLGAGHGRGGLMGPVYHPANGQCIDREAVALVAGAQRLPLQSLNWCVGSGDGRDPRANGPHPFGRRAGGYSAVR